MNTGISYYINWCRISEPSTVLLLQVAVGTTFLGAKKLRLMCFLLEGSPDSVSGLLWGFSLVRGLTNHDSQPLTKFDDPRSIRWGAKELQNPHKSLSTHAM